MTYIVDEGREYHSQLGDRVCSNSVRVLMEISGGDLLLFITNLVRRHDSLEKLVGGENNVRCVLKVMKRVLLIPGCNACNIITEFLLHFCQKKHVFLSGPRRNLFVVIRQSNNHLHFVEDKVRTTSPCLDRKRNMYDAFPSGHSLSISTCFDPLQKPKQYVSVPVNKALHSAVEFPQAHNVCKIGAFQNR